MNQINNLQLPPTTGLKSPQPLQEKHMQSTIGKAIALLNQGTRLPHSMVQELREEGIDVPSFYQFHMKK